LFAIVAQTLNDTTPVTPRAIRPKDPRIVGGKSAAMGQFPYQVMLHSPIALENSKYGLYEIMRQYSENQYEYKMSLFLSQQIQ
jgi:secreted trypsin-like serine protease